MFDEYPDIVGIEELCEMLKIGKNTAYKLINDNMIFSIRIGRIIKIPKRFIIEFCMKSVNQNLECGMIAL